MCAQYDALLAICVLIPERYGRPIDFCSTTFTSDTPLREYRFAVIPIQFHLSGFLPKIRQPLKLTTVPSSTPGFPELLPSS